MNKQIVVKFKECEIVLGADFSKKARVPGSPEYRQLKSVRQDFPDFAIVVRTIRKAVRKEAYKGLDYNFMEKYIAGHDPDGNIRKVYDEKRLLAECHSIRFPHIKAWFLRTYPEVKMYGVLETPEDEAAALALSEEHATGSEVNEKAA